MEKIRIQHHNTPHQQKLEAYLERKFARDAEAQEAAELDYYDELAERYTYDDATGDYLSIACETIIS